MQVRIGVRLGTELRNKQCHRHKDDDAQAESFSELCHKVIFDADCPVLASTSPGQLNLRYGECLAAQLRWTAGQMHVSLSSVQGCYNITLRLHSWLYEKAVALMHWKSSTAVVRERPVRKQSATVTDKSADSRHSAHNHSRCVSRALAAAERVCEAKAINLTPLRRRILEIIWRQHEPIGAYDILAEIAQDREKAAPATVYRGLEFLLNAGLVHRLDSINAFFGCDRPEGEHPEQFLVCGNCRKVSEIEDPALNRALQSSARASGFRLQGSSLEIKAICERCAKAI